MRPSSTSAVIRSASAACSDFPRAFPRTVPSAPRHGPSCWARCVAPIEPFTADISPLSADWLSLAGPILVQNRTEGPRWQGGARQTGEVGLMVARVIGAADPRYATGGAASAAPESVVRDWGDWDLDGPPDDADAFPGLLLTDATERRYIADLEDRISAPLDLSAALR